MNEQYLKAPLDDPFEWLGRGVLMDESRHYTEESPDNDTQAVYNTPLEPTITPDQIIRHAEERNNHVPVDSTTSSEQKDNEITVEDVFSIDGNQSIISIADDRSYDVQELFPTVKSPKPHTQHEHQEETSKPASTQTINWGVSCDAASAERMSKLECTQSMAANREAHQMEKITEPEYVQTLSSDNNLSYDYTAESPPLESIRNQDILYTQQDQKETVRTVYSRPTNHIEQHESLLISEDENDSNLLLPFNEEPIMAAETSIGANELLDLMGAVDQTQTVETVEPCSLYEDPPEIVNIQQSSYLGVASTTHDPVSNNSLLETDLPFGLPMGSPSPTTVSPPEELEIERAPSNPATIATVASTAFEEDSESEDSECMSVGHAEKGQTKRSIQESYALFNDDDVKPSHQQLSFATNKGFSSPEDEYDTTSIPDDEVIISPGMVAYTGFDENDEEIQVGKKSRKKSYKKLRSHVVTDAKPKAKKLIALSAILFIALIMAVSVLISLLVKDADKYMSADPNGSLANSGPSDSVGANIISVGLESNTPSYLPSTMPSTMPSSLEPSSLNLAVPTTYENTSAPSTQTTSTSSHESISEVPSQNPINAITSTSPTYLPTYVPSKSPTDMPTNNATIQNSIDFTCNSTELYNRSDLQLIWSDDKPCAKFVVELCSDDLSQWEIVHFFESTSNGDTLADSMYDDKWYDDDLYHGDLYYDDHNMYYDDHIEKRAYYWDQGFSVAGSKPAIVCLEKGLYHFIMHQNPYSYALEFANGRPVRPMLVGNYSNDIEVTPFQVTDFDVMGIASDLSAVPVLVQSNENISSSNHFNTTTLITASGTDLVHDISKAYGILFDIETGLDLIITSIELYLDTAFPAHYEVHTKENSWKESELLSGFRQISHGNIIGGGVCHDENSCTFARVQDFEPLLMQGKSRQSFYITLTTDDLVYHHYSSYGDPGMIDYTDVIQASSPELTLYLGSAVLTYPLTLADPATDFRPGGFIGKLTYEIVEEAVDLSVSNESDNEECYYYSEESCRRAANNLGLSIGGAGYHFAGHYEHHGCYFYPCSSCIFGGRAYFGISDDLALMESSQHFRIQRRLDCKTNVDNMDEESPFYCVFPSVICSHH